MFILGQERTCEEATSFDLTPYDLASAIDAVDRLLVKQAKDLSHGESVNEEFTVDCSGLVLLIYFDVEVADIYRRGNI